MEPVNLLKLNETELKEFLSSFDHVFSDCDDVVPSDLAFRHDIAWKPVTYILPYPLTGVLVTMLDCSITPGEIAVKRNQKKPYWWFSFFIEDRNDTEHIPNRFLQYGAANCLKNHTFKKLLSNGVVWETKNPMPGAGKFFELMKRLGKTVHFVSNNSLRTREDYEAKFNSAGIEGGYEFLTVPSTAIAEYLKSVKFEKTVYCVACPETIAVLTSNGFKCKEGPEVGTYYYSDYIEYLTDDEEIGAVVFDSDFKVNLPKLYKALTYLRRPEVLFINGATDRYVPLKAGLLTLGTGVFSDIASVESNRQPILLGKPGKTFGEFAMKRAGVSDPSRVLFIGDMIEQDVGLGRATGFKTLLVLTNKTKEDMMSHETLKPDFYADSLGSIVPVLEPITK